MGGYNNLELLKKGDKNSIDKFIQLNLPLVTCLSKKFLNRGYEYDDIFQIGCMGLIKAVNKFDFNYDVRFSTYAVPMIIGEIRRFLRDDDVITISRSKKTLYNKIRYKEDELYIKLDRKPTYKEIADELDVTAEEVKEANCIYYQTSIDSLDRVFYMSKENSRIELKEHVKDNSFSEMDIMHRVDLENALNKLSTIEKKVIYLRNYGYRQTQIANYFHISQVQVSRIENKALKKLRNILGDDYMGKKEDAFALFNKGLSVKEAAKKAGVSANTMHNYKTQYNKLYSIKPKNQRLDVFKLVLSGAKAQDISDKIGVALNTVYTYKNEFKSIREKILNLIEENKSNEEISKIMKVDDELINSIVDGRNNTTEISNVHEHTTVKNTCHKTNILRPITLQGKIMQYALGEGKIKVINKTNETIEIDKADINNFIQELEELKKVI